MKGSRITPYSKKQIADMDHETLASHFDSRTLRTIADLVKMSLGSSTPPRGSDETIASWRVRKRAAQEVYDEEYGTAYRTALEAHLYGSPRQKEARAISAMEKGIDPKESKDRAKRIREKDKRDSAYSTESGERLGFAQALTWEESQKVGK